ncbi:MAG: phosphatidate cytidylyltransferase [Nitrospinota bacterium]|nr:phosphatidate cytidylyltransferase [Nitrospinota bacterium]
MKRVLSGLVLIPVVLGIVQYGSPLLFLTLVTAAVLTGWYEYVRLVRHIGIHINPIVGGAMCLLLVFCFYRNDFYLVWLAGCLMSLFIAWYASGADLEDSLNQVAYSFLGVVYVSGLMSYFIHLRGMEHGNFVLYFLFMVVWSGDIAAYYVGKNIGKTPLAPKISPGKTIEGSVAGLAGSMAGGVAAKYLFFETLPLNHGLIMALLCGTMGQIGDLAESLFKRRAGVKDSGSLIPGHGGVLDRLDSLMFAGPVFYIYHRLFF